MAVVAAVAAEAAATAPHQRSCCRDGLLRQRQDLANAARLALSQFQQEGQLRVRRAWIRYHAHLQIVQSATGATAAENVVERKQTCAADGGLEPYDRLDRRAFVCVRVPLELAIVLLRIQCCHRLLTARMKCSKTPVEVRLLTVIPKLLSCTPHVFDSMSGCWAPSKRLAATTPRPCTWHATRTFASVGPHRVVNELIKAYMTRKDQQQVTGAIFFCLARVQTQFEWRRAEGGSNCPTNGKT